MPSFRFVDGIIPSAKVVGTRLHISQFGCGSSIFFFVCTTFHSDGVDFSDGSCQHHAASGISLLVAWLVGSLHPLLSTINPDGIRKFACGQ